MNEAEKAVIGCLLVNQQAQPYILDAITGEDFSDPELGEVYDKLASLWARHRKLDTVSAASVMGKELLAECAEAPIAYSNYPAYIAAVKDHTLVQRAQAVGLKLASSGCSKDDVEGAAQELAHMLAGKQSTGRFNAMDCATWFMRAMAGGRPPYFATGFGRLDRYTGWGPGDFVVIGGRPSSGKTAFTLQVARQIAQNGKRVGYYSYETSKERLSMRICTNIMRLQYDSVRRYAVQMDNANEIQLRALDHFATCPLEIVEANGRGVQWLKMDAQAQKFDVVFIDYLGLIPSRGKDSYERATMVSKDLHDFAQQTKICVVALCQLNRAGAGDLPTMENLRDSGQIEQDADNIILLHNDKETGKYTVRIAKNKDGITGDLPLNFVGSQQRFEEVAGHEYD